MGDVERAHVAELARRDRRRIAGGFAERGKDAARRKTLQRILERGLADRIVDHRHALAAGDLAHAWRKIVVAQHVVAAVGAGDFGLVVAADRADHGGAEMLGPLADDQADAAGRGVDHDGVAGLHLVGGVEEIARGHAADHHRGRGAFVDAGWQFDDACGRRDPRLGIGVVGAADRSDAVAGVRDRSRLRPTASITPALSVPRPDGNAFTACWPRRTNMSRKLSATALCRMRTSPGPGSGQRYVIPAQHLRPAGPVEQKCFHR